MFQGQSPTTRDTEEKKATPTQKEPNSEDPIKKLTESLKRPDQMEILLTIPKTLPTDGAARKGKKLPKTITDFNYNIKKKDPAPNEESPASKRKDERLRPTQNNTVHIAPSSGRVTRKKKKPRKTVVDGIRRSVNYTWRSDLIEGRKALPGNTTKATSSIKPKEDK